MPAAQVRVKVKRGCDTCRLKRVKCDDRRPVCVRCTRLRRGCSWPMPEPCLRDQRRGCGSYKSREDTKPPVQILPATSPKQNSASLHRGNTGQPLSPLVNSTMGNYLGPEGWPTDIDINQEGPPWFASSSYLEELLFVTDAVSPSLIDLVNFPPGNNTDSDWTVTWTSPDMQLLSDHHIPLPNSLTLGSKEHHALGYFQTTFSIYRTTKEPKWSTHKLLLDLGTENSMIMHFILAVSINDVRQRQGHDGSSDAQFHFEAGARQLIEIVKRSLEDDYISAMAGFLFLYLYMPKRKLVPRHRIQQLSMSVLDYVKKHNLDEKCLEPSSQYDSIGGPINITDHDRSVLARLIIWTYDEDVKCGFQGFGGYFAEYLTAHRERTMAVYEVSRTVLENHWGSRYPLDQASDDDDNAMELEFLWALTALWQDINELSLENPEENMKARCRVEKRFILLEKKYSSVFQNSAKTTKSRNRILMNADYDVVLFNALKVYYFRTTISDFEVKAPPDVVAALKNLFFITRRTFVSKNAELHDRLQWPMFLAGIETDDGIYTDWVLSRMTSSRVRSTLQQVIDHRELTGKRLSMQTIKTLLCGGEVNGVNGLQIGEQFFLETITEP